MAEPSRILDLQYGSFACRLEGFDDPVTVLQQVVRYLHDLDGMARGGSRDDLAALAQIAQTATTTTVQASLADGKLILQADAPEPPPLSLDAAPQAPLAPTPKAWPAQEQDLGRIMSQADAQLNAPEIRRQRDHLAQMKAAVAATEAARQLGEDAAADRSGAAAYRDDLDRITPIEGHAARRLDQIAAQMAQSAPVRPDFADFLANSGAVSLDDAIEAAAAYLTLFQRQRDFSRPQAMTLVQSAAPGPIPREDSLRAFGRLLRQNRIIKQENGRFQTADDNRFAVAARRLLAS